MTTAYCDPDSTVAYTWQDAAGSDHTRVDDGVRSPTSPAISGDGQSCVAGPNDDAEKVVFGVEEPFSSGTVTAVTVYAHMASDVGTISVALGAYFNSSDQSNGSKSVTTTPDWHTTTYSSLSIAAASFFPARINITTPTMGKTDGLTVSGCYLEVTYVVSGGGTHHRTETGTIGFSDTIVRRVAFGRVASAGTIGLADAIADIEQQTIQSRSLSETIGFSTAFYLDHYIARLVIETIGFSSSLAAEVQRVVSLVVSNQIGISTGAPTWTLFPVQLRQIVETMAFATTATRTANIFRTVPETLALSDSVKRLAVSLRVLADTCALTGQTGNSLSTISRHVTEQLAFADALTTNLAFYRTLISTIGMSNDEQHAMTHRRLLSESTGIIDSITRNVDYYRRLSSNLGLADGKAVGSVRRRQVIETIALATQATRNAFYGLAVTEQLAVSDARLSRAILQRRFQETLAATDNILRLAINARDIQEDIGFSTNIRRVQDALRRISNSIGLADDPGSPAPYVFPDKTAILPKRGKTYELQRKKAWTLAKRGKTFELVAA